MRRRIVLGVLVALSGCVATQLTPAGRAARVSEDPEAVRECDRIGVVEARRELNRGAYATRRADVLRRLRNRAGAVGGNVVLVDPEVPVEITYEDQASVSDRVSETAPTYSGIAYRCPSPAGES